MVIIVPVVLPHTVRNGALMGQQRSAIWTALVPHTTVAAETHSWVPSRASMAPVVHATCKSRSSRPVRWHAEATC
eukprot:12907891-Prorocentrum_lima.AAC.1